MDGNEDDGSIDHDYTPNPMAKKKNLRKREEQIRERGGEGEGRRREKGEEDCKFSNYALILLHLPLYSIAKYAINKNPRVNYLITRNVVIM